MCPLSPEAQLPPLPPHLAMVVAFSAASDPMRVCPYHQSPTVDIRARFGFAPSVDLDKYIMTSFIS